MDPIEKSPTKSKIYEKCREYLSKAERSPLHIKNWLAKNGVSKEIATDIIEQMKTEGFLCEKRYLINIQEQLLESGYPKGLIKKKLLFKKISIEEIEDFLENISNKNILKYSSKRKRLEDKEDKEIISFYLKRGFAKTDITFHIKEMRSEPLD